MAFGDKRAPQVACSGSKVRGIERAINAMRDKQVVMAKQSFTVEELMHLFVDPKHHEHLVYTYALTEPTGRMTKLHVRVDLPAEMIPFTDRPDDCFFRFKWHGSEHKPGFHTPHKEGAEDDYPAQLQPTAPPQYVEKYRQVERDLLDIQFRFAMVYKVFRGLNEPKHCKTLPQIRYVWPCIQILLKKAGYSEDAKALAEPSLRAGEKVALPPKLSSLLKDTNDTIVRAMMLDDVPTPSDNFDPEYDLVDTFQTF